MKRRAVGLGLIGAFLFGIALSDLPQVHERVHPDANQPQHECAITVISHGKCDLNENGPVIHPGSPASDANFVLPFRAAVIAPLFLSARIFEHAPPAHS